MIFGLRINKPCSCHLKFLNLHVLQAYFRETLTDVIGGKRLLHRTGNSRSKGCYARDILHHS